MYLRTWGYFPVDLRIIYIMLSTYWTGFTCAILLWLSVFEDSKLFSNWMVCIFISLSVMLNRNSNSVLKGMKLCYPVDRWVTEIQCTLLHRVLPSTHYLNTVILCVKGNLYYYYYFWHIKCIEGCICISCCKGSSIHIHVNT